MDSNADFRVGDVLVKHSDGQCQFWIVTDVTYYEVWFAQIYSISYFDDEGRYNYLPDLEHVRKYGPTFLEMCSQIRYNKWGRAYLEDYQRSALYKWDGEPCWMD